MVKGLTEMSPIRSGCPAWKNSTEGSQVGSSLRAAALRQLGFRELRVGVQLSFGWIHRALRLVGLVLRCGGIGFGLALSGLLAALLQPLGIGHLPARREPAHPGAVGALGEVDGDAELARGDGEAGDVVGARG